MLLKRTMLFKELVQQLQRLMNHVRIVGGHVIYDGRVDGC